MKLQEVFDRLASFAWNDWVYVNMECGLDLNSECSVLNPDNAEISDDGFTPKIEKDRSLSEFLQISDIRSIIENMIQQEIDIDHMKIFFACKYYFDNDVFFDFSKSDDF